MESNAVTSVVKASRMMVVTYPQSTVRFYLFIYYEYYFTSSLPSIPLLFSIRCVTWIIDHYNKDSHSLQPIPGSEYPLLSHFIITSKQP